MHSVNTDMVQREYQLNIVTVERSVGSINFLFGAVR